ncbi:DUF2789 domain-containing protein [Aquipseudomonas ullengensis]|uniref:DUF2789 domain-containing protein n=1 Tax=Aquipseudomonas ullengensis TaxID=2759166 RepID=A0A7W4LJZ3_9GAMM|nr:DUF2789 domain-containing protein [Pseudomonas ullengensis]MBB2494560.1 DUF2789 domain-containing protein [Pseudomonas ullengensis]
MDTSNHHSLRTLFEQLGLPSSHEEIAAFIRDHHLNEGENIAAAPFWSAAQASFLKEALQRDAEWAIQVDELAVSLAK